MIEKAEIVVDAARAGLRLDRFILACVPGTTRALVLDAIVRGDVRIHARRAAKGAKVAEGDRVFIVRLAEQSDVKVRPDASIPLSVAFEDDDVIVLDKPAGQAVHPLTAEETGTLANALVAARPALAGIGEDPLFPALAHRIDTDTSGLVIAAKSEEAYAFLREAFRRHRVGKEYVALVRGRPERRGRLVGMLAHDPARRGRMMVVPEGARSKTRPMKAVTEFTAREEVGAYTLLDVRIPTGVTHQIRCQLAAAGHPIAGDVLYGGEESVGELGLRRQFLHAAAVEFAHPRTGAEIRVASALPADLVSAISVCRSSG